MGAAVVFVNLNYYSHISLSFLPRRDCQSFDEGETFLDNWIQKAIASGIKQLKTMANTLTQYKEGVLNYFKHRIQSGALAGKRVSSARLEGINNKIKTMLRACYGLRDDDYLELKLRCL